jgi:carbonic anhydrase
MPLEHLLERNRAFVAGRQSAALSPPATIGLAIVACYDPRLDKILLPSLGLQPGEAFLLRTAGALVQPAGGVMRSLALGMFMFGVREIVVVGHSSCRMATFESSAFIDAFRRRGVTRDAFGSMDLREWACAIPDPKRGVEISIANIAGAAFMPPDVTVSGLVLDDTTGELTVVPAGREQAARTIADPGATARAEQVEKHVTPEAADVPSGYKVHLPPAAGALGSFMTTLESLGRWPQDVRRLRQALAAEENPIAQLRLLQTLARRASLESSEVARAYEALKQALREPGQGGRE